VAGRAKVVLVGDPYQLSPVKARGGMFEDLCDELPWSQRLSEVWRMRSAEERDMSLALRSGHGNRLRKAVGWYRNHGRLHTSDPIAMVKDATAAYISARANGDDAAILCDKWEIADAINRRLHGVYTDASAPAIRVARDQDVRVGDIIISRRNDATLTLKPGTQHLRSDRIDQVRNGNRWRVVGLDAAQGRIAAERLTDTARVLFGGDYLREHITLGYATTLHAAQGVTVGTATTRGACFTVLSDRASRAMAYVGMTRGKDDNHVFIYQPMTGEADHEHGRVTAGVDVHTIRRRNKYAAAHHFRAILANDDRPRTMHAQAERTDRELLPPAVAALLDRNDERRAARRAAWRQHNAQARAREAAYERFATARQHAAQRERGRAANRGYGLEL
jgi:AAA domain